MTKQTELVIQMMAKRLGFVGCGLPEELIEQIIGRVTCIKTIFRCTCVSKSWYALIHSAPFVESLMSLYANNNKLLLCEFDASLISGDYYGDIIDFLQGLVLQAPYFALHDDQDFQENCKLVFPRSNLQQYDACNGLICYNTSHVPHCLYLWNPTIQRERIISTPLFDLNYAPADYHTVFKLCFDIGAHLRILWITYTHTTCTVHLFSLATNSWTLITHHAPPPLFKTKQQELAYVNGIVYWPSLGEDFNWILVSLDLENGMFRERSTTWTASSIYFTPSHADASLVILGYGDKDDWESDIRRFCCVFEAYNYGLDKFRKFDINSLQTLRPPLGVRNNHELLLHNIVRSEIFSYSVESEIFTECVPATNCELLRTIPFLQTLALLNDAHATRIPPAPNN